MRERSITEVQVGWWGTICCWRELCQITPEFIEEVLEDEDLADWLIAWPTLSEAVADIRGWDDFDTPGEGAAWAERRLASTSPDPVY